MLLDFRVLLTHGRTAMPGKEIMGETSDCPLPTGEDIDKGLTGRWRRAVALTQKGLAPLLSRYTTHLVVVLLVTATLSLRGVELPGRYDYLNTPTPAPHLGERNFEPSTTRGGNRSVMQAGSLLLRAPVLRTIFADPPPETSSAEEVQPTLPSPEIDAEEAMRREIITYTVRTGDTVSGIAAHFGLDFNTLMWSNPSIEAVPDLLKLGQELTILPVDGAYHTVVFGDTLESIAKYYKVTVEDIVNYELNHIPDGGKLTMGLKLVVPGGKKPYVPRVVAHYSGPIPDDASRGTGVFGWPTSGRITCGFNCYPRHYATDIGNVSGTPVYAADSGYVVKAGWNNDGYGKMILIDHGNGFQTLYAHLHVILTEEGTSVAKGTLIGKMGDTGNASGPHLHFEIRENGKQRNPTLYLPTD